MNVYVKRSYSTLIEFLSKHGKNSWYIRWHIWVSLGYWFILWILIPTFKTIRAKVNIVTQDQQVEGLSLISKRSYVFPYFLDLAHFSKCRSNSLRWWYLNCGEEQDRGSSSYQTSTLYRLVDVDVKADCINRWFGPVWSHHCWW